jgi:hypothetical protein
MGALRVEVVMQNQALFYSLIEGVKNIYSSVKRIVVIVEK